MRYFAFVCSMVFLTACALNKYQQLDDLVSFEFSRTSCYGKCPAYQVKIINDSVFYYGSIYTPKKGPFTAIGGRNLYKKLIREARKAHFFELNAQYPVNGGIIPDLPNVKTKFVTKSLMKEVTYNHEAPPQLIKFHSYIDSQLDSLVWIPSAAPR
jgi:hypothetical protein